MRIAFIGTGGIARRHAEGLAKRSDITFVGATDVALERAQDFAHQYGGAAFASLDEMLDTTKPDAAWVCLPPFAHGQAELALLQRRIPFTVEKPISNALDTARTILAAVERSGAIVSAGYMNRYRRSVARAQELLADDPAILLHGGWIGGTPGVPWWRVKELSGGQVLEQTTHIFDVVRYLVGEPTLVYARAARGYVRDLPDYDVEDASTVAIQFASGAVGNLMSCCANRSGGAGVHLTLVAANHVTNLTGWGLDAVITKNKLEREQITGEIDIFEIEDAAFVGAVTSGDPSGIRSPYADAVRTLAFCLAANRSMELGEAVQIDAL
jgi:predicted dehydrogenase